LEEKQFTEFFNIRQIQSFMGGFKIFFIFIFIFKKEMKNFSTNQDQQKKKPDQLKESDNRSLL
jgi:hypothetical protein